MRKTAFALTALLAALVLTVGWVAAQPLPTAGVEILINRDAVNVRLSPALGADILGFLNAGYRTNANGRSPDNQWVRIDFNGQEGWVGTAVINVFGDMNILPVADPRSIPYGGFDSPRSGASDATSAINGRLADSGMRLRAGPSTAYPVLANPPRYSVFPLTGRTASNGWVQVNFNGTLGWMVAGFVEFQDNHSITELPVDGIVASAPPQSDSTRENYFGILRLMRDRVELAQPSLDSIRATWTTVALGDRAACQNFPARPSDINIANELLAANYGTLEPLRVDFNAAMATLRQAIDLWIDSCRLPQPPSGVVGEATVSGALNVIQTADAQFANLRARLNELAPPDLEVGAGSCLFTYQDQFDILQVIAKGQLILDSLTPRKTVVGFCLDAAAGDALRVELLIASGTASPLLSVSPFDNPTQFLGVGRPVAGQALISLGPIQISAPGRYLIIISDTAETPPNADYALLVSNIAGQTVTGPGLGIDPTTGQIVVNPVQAVSTPAVVPTIASGIPTSTPGVVPCPGTQLNCNLLLSCAEAQACLRAGNFTLDPDNDGIPCEETLCK
jgi:uncharacterized protein YraI